MNQDELKQQVANAAINYVMPKLRAEDILGVGTGSTANHFIAMLDKHQSRFKGAVASSEESAKRLRALNILVFDLNEVENIRIYVDGADETNAQFQLIKGGGAALTREKIVTAASDEFVCIADESKWVSTLGAFPLPVEVIPMARNYVARELSKLGGRPVYREGILTDNHCDILDVHDLNISDPCKLESSINQITGVVTNGLFALRPANLLLLGTSDGVRIIYPGLG